MFDIFVEARHFCRMLMGISGGRMFDVFVDRRFCRVNDFANLRTARLSQYNSASRNSHGDAAYPVSPYKAPKAGKEIPHE
jgi:hypothetical protein